MECQKEGLLDLADKSCKKICRSVIVSLQRMKDPSIIGDASGLNNVWDQICVQVQDQEWLNWDLYYGFIINTIQNKIESLHSIILYSVWVKTEPGSNWLDL